MADSSYLIKIPIFKKFYKFVVSKGGANIRGIRDQTDGKIGPMDSDMVTITGEEDSVDKAQLVPQIPDLSRTPILFSCVHMMTPCQLPMTVTSQAGHSRHQEVEGQVGVSQSTS